MRLKRTFGMQAGMFERWVGHLACLGWWSPPPDPDVTVADASRPDLNEQLQDLYRAVRQQELIWKTADRHKGTSRPKRGNKS